MKSVSYTYDKAKLTRFEEIFEEYEIELLIKSSIHRMCIEQWGLYLI
ncbi:lysyl-tRNA synthetase [Streptococcus pseudopneumoniae]|nr:lysyl-tRNA synthetase [Streptococcus pseudopneumoniae]